MNNVSIPVKIQVFEGPLDLLLHLIEKNKFNKIHSFFQKPRQNLACWSGILDVPQ